ncbi:MAG: hypothetical protein AB8B71_16915 [Paracoccaceae bacterium]
MTYSTQLSTLDVLGVLSKVPLAILPYVVVFGAGAYLAWRVITHFWNLEGKS